MPSFCRHNRFLQNCPICREPEPPVSATRAPRRSSSGARSGGSSRGAGGARSGRMVVRRAHTAADDGYRNALVPGLKATQDAERLAGELAFSAARLRELDAAPPGLYAEIASESDLEQALWTAFLLAYLSPVEGPNPFEGIRAAAATRWASGELPDLGDVPLGPRTAHDPARGNETLEAYRAWAQRAGSQEAAFRGEESWTPERRFGRIFERLALPGLHYMARVDLLTTLQHLELAELEADAMRLQGNDDVVVAAKRVFGIGDAMLLHRRARELAAKAEVPVEALELALYNWGAGERKATLGARDASAEPGERAAVDAALGL